MPEYSLDVYSDNLNTTSICSILPPATPVVTNEWNASGGTIEIITDKLFAADGITVTGYTHNIRFVNVNFSSTENSFSFTSYNFGNNWYVHGPDAGTAVSAESITYKSVQRG